MADKTYTEHIEGFERALGKFEKVLEEQGSNIRDIRQALLGNEFGDPGMVRRLEMAESDIQELKEFKKKITYYAMGISAATGTTVAGAVKLIFGV